MQKWAKIAMRTVGVLNIALAFLAVSFLAVTVRRVLIRHVANNDPAYPYVHTAFWTLTVINIVFLLILLTTAVRFVQLKTSAVMPYSIAVVALVICGLLNGSLWLKGHGIGSSIGAASGIGNMGISPFALAAVVPYLYPIASVILLQVLRKRDAVSSEPKAPTSA